MMTLVEFAFIADENIHPELISFLKNESLDIVSLKEKNLLGATDEKILLESYRQNRIIITQDSDFGKLIYTTNINFVGVIYLRPGHIEAAFHIETLKTVFKEFIAVEPPFILVAENTPNKIKVRLRNHIF